MPDEALGRDPGHRIVGMMHPLPSLEAQGKRQAFLDFQAAGGQQTTFVVVAHAF
jgi:hypothetical protein